jgi:hypothetical protein
MKWRSALIVLLALALPAPSVLFAADADELRIAKALFFDREYAEARAAWQRILESTSGSQADTAAFWVARCSENLEEDERAFREYGAYLVRRPSDATLREEAETSRVGLAARLYKSGRRQHLSVLKRALDASSKTVRYYAALQLSSLGAEPGALAIPALRGILQDEDDPDLLDRARLALLRVDPGSLAGVSEPAASESRRRKVSWIKLRIFKPGRNSPEVSVSMPVALAELVFKSLPDEVRRDLRSEGYDVDNFLKRLKPTEILEIESEDGATVKIWIE